MQEFDKNQLPQEPPKPVAKEEKPNSAPATESFLCKPPVRTAISASFGGLVGAGTSYTGPAALGLGAAAATMLSVVLQTNCKSELDWGETAISAALGAGGAAAVFRMLLNPTLGAQAAGAFGAAGTGASELQRLGVRVSAHIKAWNMTPQEQREYQRLIGQRLAPFRHQGDEFLKGVGKAVVEHILKSQSFSEFVTKMKK